MLLHSGEKKQIAIKFKFPHETCEQRNNWQEGSSTFSVMIRSHHEMITRKPTKNDETSTTLMWKNPGKN